MRKASSKISLNQLQEEMQKQLTKMSKSLEKQHSLNLRHTIGSNPEVQLKKTLKQIRSLKSLDRNSPRKREASLTSTRIPQASHSALFRNLPSIDKSDKQKEQKTFKAAPKKTKLKKKLSNQDSPKAFLKLTRGQSDPFQSSPQSSSNRDRKQVPEKYIQSQEKPLISAEQYERVIYNQKNLITQLQKIIEFLLE